MFPALIARLEPFMVLILFTQMSWRRRHSAGREPAPDDRGAEILDTRH